MIQLKLVLTFYSVLHLLDSNYICIILSLCFFFAIWTSSLCTYWSLFNIRLKNLLNFYSLMSWFQPKITSTVDFTVKFTKTQNLRSKICLSFFPLIIILQTSQLSSGKCLVTFAFAIGNFGPQLLTQCWNPLYNWTCNLTFEHFVWLKSMWVRALRV